MRNKSIKFIFFLLAGIPYVANAQREIIKYDVKWLDPIEVVEGETTKFIPNIEEQNYKGKVPNFSIIEPIVQKGEYSLEIVNFSVAPCQAYEESFLNSLGLELSAQPNIEMASTYSRDELFRSINFTPYIKVNNQYKRITSIEISQTYLGKKPTLVYNKDFVNNSVLASGEWYKIRTSETSIYKLTKPFLESCGIDVENINPYSIHLFGNSDGKLPELNSAERTDDLAQNAISYIGMNDGSFDGDDYILFHAWSPHRWDLKSGDFLQERNIYSDFAYYFIKVDENLTPMEIQTIPDAGLTPNQMSNSYDYYDVHELDLINLVKGGQLWYGETFDANLSQNFTFNVSNLVVGAPSMAKFSLAYFKGPGSLKGYINGTEIFSNPLPSTNGYMRGTYQNNYTANSGNIVFNLTIQRNSPDVITYLDKIEINTRRQLHINKSVLHFRDLNTVGIGNITEFSLSNGGFNTQIWDISDKHNPKILISNFDGSTLRFISPTDSLKEFLATDQQNFLVPTFTERVENQNLHGLAQADYIIVTHPSFVAQANRLADLHRSEGLVVHVATTNQIYNEFSSGALDVTAIRSFARMFYERSQTMSGPKISNLLLFGDGTFDPKNRVGNNNNMVPCYETYYSEDLISAIASDDYYAMLDDNDAFQSFALQDIGVGRLLISNNEMAIQQVDKVEHYMKNGSNLFINQDANTNGKAKNFGDWRLKYVQIADDEESGYFVQNDAEPQSDNVRDDYPEMNAKKLYLDAYQQTTSAGGERYPDIYEGITRAVERGSLMLNYSGHGGEVGVAEERVITIPQINDWKNANNLPLFVTSTCEFTRYDDPSRESAGELMSINPVGGAIALMTTTRPVYISQNTVIGQRLYETVFERDTNHIPLDFGEIVRRVKNASGTGENRRVFTLIGDPALKLALPRLRVVMDSVNGLAINTQIDTLKALTMVTMTGHIEDYNNTILSNFNGVLSPSVYDKSKTTQTLGQNVASPVVNFDVQENIIYKGQATIKNGYFTFSFYVPKDIDYQYGYGKISLYGNSDFTDAGGSDTNIIIGGFNPNGLADDLGPEIDLYMNDESFVNGGLTDETPTLLAFLKDDYGINTAGNGVGHDITAIIDIESDNPIILNEYYTADLDSYQSGSIRFKLSTLEVGKHTLTLKAWDINNNSAEKTIEFNVQMEEDLALDHVLNYPNPFTTNTNFYFEHNQAENNLEAQIEIFTVSGRLVKTINRNVSTVGFRSEGIPWDGKDEFGDQLAKGVYIYRLKVKTQDGSTDEKLEKLVLLK